MNSHRVTTPLLLQMEAVECGAAALGIVLGFFGRFVPLAELRRECGISRDGSKASNMVLAARRYGLHAKGYSKEAEALKQMKLPLIVFWQFNHFVVVEGFGSDEVYLNDPAYGHVTVPWDEFDRGFTGVVLACEPGPDFRRGGERPSVLAALGRRLRHHYSALAYCFLAGLFLVLPNLAAATFTGIFIDSVLTDARVNWLRPLLTAMAVTGLIQFLLKFLQLHYLRRLKLALSARLSSRFLWHLLQLPVSFYAQRFPGEISGRSILNDKVAEMLSGRLTSTMIDAATMACYLVVMIHYDPFLTAIGVSFAALNFLALGWLAGRRVEANQRLANEAGKTTAIAMATLQSMETIKAAGGEPFRFSQWAGHYARSCNAQQELQQASLSLGVLPAFLQTLAMVLIFAVGGLRVIQGDISLGMLVAFQVLMASFLSPLASLLELGKLLQEMQGDLLRLEDVLDNPTSDAPRPRTPADAARPTEDASLKLSGDLELKEITFGYSPCDPPLLEAFNLRVKPGQRVALVGASGSGKSTLARLISRLYRPWSGRLLFDGRECGEVPLSQIHHSVSLVDQDVLLFEGTVRENLTLWDRTVPDAVLRRACQDAAIHDDLIALPGGYDSLLPEGGTSLSGGQRQRLEIARALVNDPTLLILDEATSALDAETERIISENLRLRGCTCVLVAHRLSAIRDCDEIVVLDRGRVVERGRHPELWAAGGHYARLIQHEES